MDSISCISILDCIKMWKMLKKNNGTILRLVLWILHGFLYFMRKSTEHQRSSFFASWLQTQYDQLLHAYTAITSPGLTDYVLSNHKSEETLPSSTRFCQACYYSNKKVIQEPKGKDPNYGPELGRAGEFCTLGSTSLSFKRIMKRTQIVWVVRNLTHASCQII